MQKKTSRDALIRYRRGGVAMQHDYDRIVDCLKLNPKGFTRNEIAQMTTLPINRVTARVNELIEDDLLKTQGQRVSQVTGYIGEIVTLNRITNR